MVLQWLKLPIRAVGRCRNVQDYRFSALRVWVNECVCALTHWISPDTVPLESHTHKHAHITSPDNSAEPQLPTVKPSISQPADRRIFNISNHLCDSYTVVHHTRKEKAAEKCVDCCVSHSSCCRALTIRLTQEMSRGDPGNKSLVRHQP